MLAITLIFALLCLFGFFMFLFSDILETNNILISKVNWSDSDGFESRCRKLIFFGGDFFDQQKKA